MTGSEFQTYRTGALGNKDPTGRKLEAEVPDIRIRVSGK